MFGRARQDLAILGDIRGGEAQQVGHVGQGADFKQVFEFRVANAHALLQPHAVSSSEEASGNLKRREKVLPRRFGKRKVEDPASLICRPEAHVPNVGFIFQRVLLTK